MKLLVFLLFFAALAADVYIYRSVVCWHFRRLSVRMAYIVFALVTDGAALSALLLYSFTALPASSGVMAVMWLIWMFFLTALPKLLYAAGGLLDFLARLVIRRRTILFRGLGLAVSLVLMVVMVCGATVGRTRPRVVEVEVCSPRVPAGFDGYRIVQISDLHIGTMSRPVKRITRLAGKIAGLDPDMVVSTGDIVNLTHLELTPAVAGALSGITAPDGVWSVWGNHDLGFYIRDTTALPVIENFSMLDRKVREMGWRTLSDQSVYIGRGDAKIALTGVDYPRTERLNGHNSVLGGADLNAAFALLGAEDPFDIVLAHTPQMWRGITQRGRGDLTLSGHTHAMQLKLNIFGIKWSPAELIYDEWSGRYTADDEKNSLLYVNDGIGCVGYPMRIGARPEVTLFILKRCE